MIFQRRYTTILFTLLLSIVTLQIQAQNERKFVRQGNRIYNKALKDTSKLDTIAFSQAEVAYRKALEKRPDDLKWNFNLGNSLYKQMRPAQADTIFSRIARNVDDKVDKSKAFYNLGNSLLVQQKFDESIEAYKNALRQNPDDLESKYNLLYAMNMKKQQDQNQDQNQDQQNQDKDNQDQNKDQDNQDQDKQNQDQQNQDQQSQDQQNQDQQSQDKQHKISMEQAERLLQALEDAEQKTQDKVKKANAAKKQQTEKDW